jgi:Skp family chaperone for outer membrane proteins
MIEEYFAKPDYDGIALSSTSANHICNKAKEVFEALQAEVDGFKFVNVEYKVAGEQNSILAEGGKTIDWLNTTVENVRKIGKLKSLIAWLREGINEKEQEGKRIHQVSLSMFLRDNNIEERQEPTKGSFDMLMFDIERPQKESPVLETLTADDVKASWSIGERQKFFQLEAEVANIGKLVHLKGAFNNARKELHRIGNKTEVIGEGTPSLTVKTYRPSADVAEVDKVFLALQEEHRKLQSELNGMKHAIEVKVAEFNDKALAEFRKQDALATQKYKEARAKWDAEYQKRAEATAAKYDAEKADYDAWYNEVSSQHNQWLITEGRRVSDLRILIPKNLVDIYNLVKDS